MDADNYRKPKQRISLKWGLISALGIAGVFFILFWGIILLKPANPTMEYPTAVLQIIVAPTFTVTPQATSTPQFPNNNGESQSSTSDTPIYLGDFVAISGTLGDGLRLRSKPSLDGEVEFIAYEGEVFKVDDGPKENSGYNWWHLTAPYDESVQGWAVENYLKPVQQP